MERVPRYLSRRSACFQVSAKDIAHMEHSHSAGDCDGSSESVSVRSHTDYECRLWSAITCHVIECTDCEADRSVIGLIGGRCGDWTLHALYLACRDTREAWSVRDLSTVWWRVGMEIVSTEGDIRTTYNLATAVTGYISLKRIPLGVLQGSTVSEGLGGGLGGDIDTSLQYGTERSTICISLIVGWDWKVSLTVESSSGWSELTLSTSRRVGENTGWWMKIRVEDAQDARSTHTIQEHTHLGWVAVLDVVLSGECTGSDVGLVLLFRLMRELDRENTFSVHNELVRSSYVFRHGCEILYEELNTHDCVAAGLCEHTTYARSCNSVMEVESGQRSGGGLDRIRLQSVYIKDSSMDESLLDDSDEWIEMGEIGETSQTGLVSSIDITVIRVSVVIVEYCTAQDLGTIYSTTERNCNVDKRVLAFDEWLQEERGHQKGADKAVRVIVDIILVETRGVCGGVSTAMVDPCVCGGDRRRKDRGDRDQSVLDMGYDEICENGEIVVYVSTGLDCGEIIAWMRDNRNDRTVCEVGGHYYAARVCET
ncbi:hypothetical protein Tco_0615298 [Tanacetum coccineum]